MLWSWNWAASARCAASVFAATITPEVPRSEPVDDARAKHAPDPGEVATVVEERVHQGAARVPGRRVHDEPGRLVDDDQLRVLVEHDERDRLGGDLGGLRLRRRSFQPVAHGDLLAGAPGRPVPRDEALLDPALHARARRAAQRGERAVQALARLGLPDDEARRHRPGYQMRERTWPLR